MVKLIFQNTIVFASCRYTPFLLALPTKARIFVFRFIIEYSSLMDFGSYVIIGPIFI